MRIDSATAFKVGERREELVAFLVNELQKVAIWLTGKPVDEDLLSKELKFKMAEFYKTIAPKIKRAKAMGEKEYKAFITKALADYNKDGKFDAEDLKSLMKEAHASWKHLKKNL